MAKECITACPNINECLNKVDARIPFSGARYVDDLVEWSEKSYDCPGPRLEVELVDKSFARIRQAFGRSTVERLVHQRCPAEEREQQRLNYLYSEGFTRKPKESGPAQKAGIVVMAVILAGGAVNSARITVDYVRQRVKAYEAQLETSDMPPINLEVPPLQAEREFRYVASLVGVHKDIKSNFSVSDGRCTGVNIGSGYVVTAGHCLRKSYDKEGNEFGVTSDGEDVRERIWVSSGEREFDIVDESFYPEYEAGNNNYDVEVVRVEGLEETEPAIPLATTNLEWGAPVYMYSRYGQDTAKVYGGRVTRLPSEENRYVEVAFALENIYPVCIPGTSGTGVANEHGEMAGVISKGPTVLEVTAEVARQYNLADAEIGKSIAICEIAPPSLIVPLVD